MEAKINRDDTQKLCAMNESEEKQPQPQTLYIQQQEKQSLPKKAMGVYLDMWSKRPLVTAISTVALAVAGFVGGNFYLQKRALEKDNSPTVQINTGKEDPFGDQVQNPQLDQIQAKLDADFPQSILFRVERNEIYPFAQTMNLPENEYDATSPEFTAFRRLIAANNKCHSLDVGLITVGESEKMFACPIKNKKGKVVAMAANPEEINARRLRQDLQVQVLFLIGS